MYKWICLFIVTCLLSGFIQKPVKRAWRLTGFAQGTNWNVTYYAADSVVLKSQVDSILAMIDSSLSIYKPNSLISKFNRSEKGITVDYHFAQVVKKSLLIYRQTNGAFDITIQPLVDAWGFGVTKTNNLPDSAKVKSLLKCVGSGHLKLNNNYLVKDKPCLRIDVNGIAQGYTVDLIADHLEKNYIQNYLVELGGEIRVKGQKQPGNGRMTIGIEAPGEDDFNPLPMQRLIRPGSGAITTSGNYRKYYQVGGKKISHLIDTKSGYPVSNELISVTVYAKDAITADGYDNALMGMGLKEGLSFIKKKKDIAAYFIYHRPDGAIADTASFNFPKFVD